MVRRIVCLLIVAVLVAGVFFDLQVSADDGGTASSAAHSDRVRVTHRPNALASAMLLVLAGMSISMLFDKRK